MLACFLLPTPARAQTALTFNQAMLACSFANVPYLEGLYDMGGLIASTSCDVVVPSSGQPFVELNGTFNAYAGRCCNLYGRFIDFSHWGFEGGVPASVPGKNMGGGTPTVGDPINPSNGSKYQEDTDYQGGKWLIFSRYYNSQLGITSEMGTKWRHSFDRFLSTPSNPNGGPPNAIALFRPDGSQENFTEANGVWTGDTALIDSLTEIDNGQGVATGYTLFNGVQRTTETYNAAGVLQSVVDETGQGITLTYSTASTPSSVAPFAGLLLTVTDPHGRQLKFTYNSAGKVHQVIQPDGGVLTYGYDSTGDLTSVEYPDTSTRQYVYNESALTGGANLVGALTGMVDEAGVRYASTTFNSAGLAISSTFAGSAYQTQVTYNSDGSASVQFPLGHSATMGFTVANGFNRTSSLNQPCGPDCGQPSQSLTYDANGYPASKTDFNGNLTKTQYDAYGLLEQQIDASGSTNQRTTITQWNTTLRVPLARTVINASGTIVSSEQWFYNALGQTLARCEIDPTNSTVPGYACSNSGTVPAGVRRWTYTYCTAVDTSQCPIVGLMLTATGPRTDTAQTTTYSYYMASSATNCGTPGAACYQAGDLHTVTDAQGHVTTIASYDANGRATRITDGNGINTDMTYTPRGWLASRSVGGATTSFTYTPYGAVQTVTDADGVTTTYGYDAAHRLVKITDAQGNYTQYTLDAAGNKTAEQVYDTSGTLHKSLTRSFNTLGQLTKVMDGLKHTIFDASASSSYDADGNLVQSADGLGVQRQQGYDALNRLVQMIDNYNGAN
jgi:YD repeat-containing protein